MVVLLLSGHTRQDTRGLPPDAHSHTWTHSPPISASPARPHEPARRAPAPRHRGGTRYGYGERRHSRAGRRARGSTVTCDGCGARAARARAAPAPATPVVSCGCAPGVARGAGGHSRDTPRRATQRRTARPRAQRRDDTRQTQTSTQTRQVARTLRRIGARPPPPRGGYLIQSHSPPAQPTQALPMPATAPRSEHARQRLPSLLPHTKPRLPRMAPAQDGGLARGGSFPPIARLSGR